MRFERIVLSLSDAQNIMKNYLEKIMDFLNGEIVRCETGVYLMDKCQYHGEEAKRLRELNNRSYFDILRYALIDKGYPVKYIKEVNHNGEIKYECIYELVSKRGR